MRKLILGTVSALLLIGCTTTKTEYVYLEDPRIVSLQEVSINLSTLPPELDLSQYDIEFDVVTVGETRYVAMSTEEYRKLILLLTSSAEHISLLRSILAEQNRLIDSALDREEVAESDQRPAG